MTKNEEQITICNCTYHCPRCGGEAFIKIKTTFHESGKKSLKYICPKCKRAFKIKEVKP